MHHTGGSATWTLTTQRTAGQHRLGLDSDIFPTYSPENCASWRPEHKHNEYDLLSKEHGSLNQLPLTTKIKLPSFRQKLTFQLFSATEMLEGWCSPLF